MIIPAKLCILIVALLLICLCACQQTKNPSTLFPSELPTATNFPRWKVYEKALLNATVRKSFGACEWAIYGVLDKRVFVWAICRVNDQIGTTVSVPAVIYLAENGEIENVIIPRIAEYSQDMVALFPPDIRARMSTGEYRDFIDSEHLEERLKSGAPPFVVVSGTPLP